MDILANKRRHVMNAYDTSYKMTENDMGANLGKS
jgi:hypothetical protein